MKKRISQFLDEIKHTSTEQKRLVIDIALILTVCLLGFYFAKEHDVFELLVEVTRDYEAWELDELFTLLMFSGVALFSITIRNIKFLKKEITRRQDAEDEIKRLAFFDGLTGLPNRQLFTNRLEHFISYAKRTDAIAGVMFIDLDNFKEVNDTYGHAIGDELLVLFSKRLKGHLRNDDTLSRFAGDEFVILLGSIKNTQDLPLIASKIVNCVRQPFALAGNEVHVGMSIGIATFPNDGCVAEDLFKNADTAMYHAKSEGKNTYRFFSSELDAVAKYKLSIANQLRKALERKEFTLHYQPIIDKSTNLVKGAEALLRWHNETLGHVSPADFVPIAEEVGIIQAIGDWVVKEACQQAKQWHSFGHKEFVMSVNMSAKQLANDAFVAYVKKCLEKIQLPSHALTLELTESTVMYDVDGAASRLRQLKALGLSIAIDDFGTGYSSLAYLHALPIDRIKIDRSFVMKLTEDKDSVLMVETMIMLAENLQLAVTVEGVETQQQKEFFNDTSIDKLQGFYFSKPVSAEEFEQHFLSNQLVDSITA
ncbi:putative bifunctional diguanylate cyclase/phosphodiesterase [Thalassotalea euphylliae]|uniref:putative bifunctional diguanylate cyclase/phosphodiesterase n=1 Tax=Thalassotalea euphylliae TaxID=1655234 RepID=UPI0036251A4A